MHLLQLAANQSMISAIPADTIPTGPPPPPPPLTPVSLEISPDTMSIETPNTEQLTPVFKDVNDVVVTGTVSSYSSSAPSKATVDSSGLITAVAAGSANITAHSSDPVLTSNVCAVTVTAPLPPNTTPVSLEIAPTTVSFNFPGATSQLVPTFKNSDGAIVTGTVTSYVSDDPTVATVNGSGLITPVHNGTCTITAHSTSPALDSNTIDVTVIDETPASVTLTESSISLRPGDQHQVFAVVKNAELDVLTTPANFRSHNTLVATVGLSSGLVTANDSAGIANITGFLTSPAIVSSPFVVTNLGPVTPPPPTGFPNLPPGFTLLSKVLTCDVLPNTSIDDSIEWVRAGAITKVVDGSCPIDSTNVLQESYPPASGNGASNGYLYTASSSNPQHWPLRPVELYISFYYKYSANFPTSLGDNKIIYCQIGNDDNGSVGNKFYYRGNGNADYRFSGAVDASSIILDPNHATPYNSPIIHATVVQGIISVDSIVGSTFILNQDVLTSDPTQWKYSARDTWHRHEVYVKAHTPGNQDGTIRVWFDEVKIIDYTSRIKWSNNLTQDTWWTMFWDPVYNNAVPNDAVNAYHHMKNLTVYGKAA